MKLDFSVMYKPGNVNDIPAWRLNSRDSNQQFCVGGSVFSI